MLQRFVNELASSPSEEAFKDQPTSIEVPTRVEEDMEITPCGEANMSLEESFEQRDVS